MTSRHLPPMRMKKGHRLKTPSRRLPHGTALTYRSARHLTAVAVAVVLTAGAPGSAHASSAPQRPDAAVPPPCGTLASAPPLPLAQSGVPAAHLLRQLAGRIVAVPADTQTGRYTRISLHQSAASSSIGDCVETVMGTSSQTMWRDEDRDSGVINAVAWHPLTDPAPPARTDRYRPGDLPGTIPGHVPTDPVALSAALDAVYPGEPARRVQAIGDLAGHHDTPLAARRAILRVLADVPGLVLNGPVTVGHRTGIAVSVIDGTDRYVLVLDQRSGEIRASEDVLIDPVIGRNLAVHTPYSQTRTIITDRGRSTSPTQPAR